MKRGERQARRTKTALKAAFQELMSEKSYSEITVGEIAERADVGRVTFYRHFDSKADVLVSLHDNTFHNFSFGLSTADDWLRNEPPIPLIQLLEKYQSRNVAFSSISYGRNGDSNYLQRSVRKLMDEQFEKNLHAAFSESDSSIPFRLLSESISSIYSRLILSWMTEEPRSMTAYEIAAYIHRMSRSLVCEALR